MTISHSTALARAVGVALLCAVWSLAWVVPGHSDQSLRQVSASEADLADFRTLYMHTLIGEAEQRRAALAYFVNRGDMDVVPSLILILRIGGNHREVIKAVEQLTGEPIANWRDGMLWLERNPHIAPHPTYREFKLWHFASIDKRFRNFFDPEFTSRDVLKIRFSEIVWGGARVDSIPSLDNPKMISARQANYLVDEDLVFGVNINGDVRAYPLRIMGWHEMLNDVVGDVPVALAYCALCGSGILFDTRHEKSPSAFVFGSTGLLYRSNKLMFDRATKSLWNQFTGKPVGGPLVDKGIKLKMRPLVITSWAKWKKDNPNTTVLSLDTGHFRNYDSGAVYREYFASPNLMFPTTIGDESRLRRKDYVFGIRQFGAAKAWPLDVFAQSRVINDRIGTTAVVLIGDYETRTVRAYSRGSHTFMSTTGAQLRSSSGDRWMQSEAFLTGPDGSKLPRLPGHVAYWFAWDRFVGTESELYSE